MGKDRISLDSDGDRHGEPFITTEDHLRERQDKSKMPWTERHEREQQETQANDGPEQDTTAQRSARTQSTRSRNRSRTGQEQTSESSPDPEDVERQAVQKLVQQLKDRGMSDEFIEENMDKISERVREELR